MRHILLFVVLIAGLAGPVRAQSSDIQATIGAQIDAFRADDFARAFTFASPTIRNMFRTPENFGGMVRNGYPMVWRPADVRYLDLRDVDGTLWQKVRITDGAGRVHILDYQMIRLENGWKINAVHLLEPDELSV